MNRFEKMINSSFSNFMNFLYKIMVLNILYLLSIIAGLFVFSFAPATVATLTCMKAINEKKEFPLFKTYVHIFKSEYKKSMIFFVFYLVTTTIVTVSFFYYLNSQDIVFNNVGIVVTGLLVVINLASLIHMFLISIYTPNISFKAKLKYSYLMIVYSPFLTLFLVVVNLLLIVFSYIFVTFSFMFTFAITAYYNISVSRSVYLKVSNDHEPLDVLSH